MHVLCSESELLKSIYTIYPFTPLFLTPEITFFNCKAESAPIFIPQQALNYIIKRWIKWVSKRSWIIKGSKDHTTFVEVVRWPSYLVTVVLDLVVGVHVVLAALLARPPPADGPLGVAVLKHLLQPHVYGVLK